MGNDWKSKCAWIIGTKPPRSKKNQTVLLPASAADKGKGLMGDVSGLGGFNLDEKLGASVTWAAAIAYRELKDTRSTEEVTEAYKKTEEYDKAIAKDGAPEIARCLVVARGISRLTRKLIEGASAMNSSRLRKISRPASVSWSPLMVLSQVLPSMFN
ncbi:hypothetical protein AgCh_004149 [Apium graveolens]